MGKVVTMQDIATSLGISKATVSFAFNNPEKIKKETYDRIMERAKELEYLPNPAAKRLSIGKNYTIGFLLPQSIAISLNNPYAIEVLKGIGAGCEERGYTLTLVPPLKSSVTDALSLAAVDGVIAMGLRIRGDIKETLKFRRIPVVSIDGSKSDGVSSINIDDEEAGYEQMKFVLEKGHRDILIVALGKAEYEEDEENSTGKRRLTGYKRALSEFGLTLDERMVVSVAPTEEAGEMVFETYYEKLKPSVIVCMADANAFGIIRKARERGLRIPEDLSIIGFDGLNEKFTSLTLSTIKQPAYEKGEKATSLLFSLLDGKEESEIIYVEHRLIEGNSVKTL